MTLFKSLSGNRFRCRAQSRIIVGSDVSDEDLGHSVERSSTMSQSIDTDAMNHLLQLDTVSSGQVGGRRWVESRVWRGPY